VAPAPRCHSLAPVTTCITLPHPTALPLAHRLPPPHPRNPCPLLPPPHRFPGSLLLWARGRVLGSSHGRGRISWLLYEEARRHVLSHRDSLDVMPDEATTRAWIAAFGKSMVGPSACSLEATATLTCRNLARSFHSWAGGGNCRDGGPGSVRPTGLGARPHDRLRHL
jgi:hypothetical protein